MLLSIIAALSENRVIGREGGIPWLLPEDMRRFKALTMGHAVIMGRRTFDALDGIPLPGRRNIVLTATPGFEVAGFKVVSGLEEALAPFRSGDEEVFVIGGGTLYEQTLPIVDRLYLTLVHERVEGDAFFPEFSEDDFIEVKREEGEGSPPHSFVEYERARS